MMQRRHGIRAMAAALAALLLSACSAPKPWVKPYERQNLADEIMGTERFPLDDALMAHLRESREGGRGADGAGGGGCGCN